MWGRRRTALPALQAAGRPRVAQRVAVHVAGDVNGNCLHLTYPMKGGMKVEQRIYLQPGGKTALNRMTVSKLGITVAHLNETISKLD